MSKRTVILKVKTFLQKSLNKFSNNSSEKFSNVFRLQNFYFEKFQNVFRPETVKWKILKAYVLNETVKTQFFKTVFEHKIFSRNNLKTFSNPEPATEKI